ncbi:MAG: hydroxysqualene dehydroxylase HpnE [Betaproteobacteria bacterium]
MNVAVIGAGWAGLAAAVALKQAGSHVTVFEASGTPGGRARGVTDVQLGTIDNGQHLMLGAYTESLALIQQLSPERPEHALLARLPLTLESADGSFRLRAPHLIAPLHLAWALSCAQGLTLHDRARALRMAVTIRLKGWKAPTGQSVRDLLSEHKQTDTLVRRLWEPLCLAALNTPLREACAQLFLNVLRDGLGGARKHSDLIIPRVDLSSLWPSVAAQHITMRYRHIVRQVKPDQHGIDVDGKYFDACVVAVPPYAARRILAECLDSADTDSVALSHRLEHFEYRAIATVTLQLDRPWTLPTPLMMLDENKAAHQYGQWVFTRPDQPDQLTVVVSDAPDLLKVDRGTLIDAIASQIRSQCLKHPKSSSALPNVVHHRLIVEKRATFDACIGLQRPSTETRWPRLVLAGDWTDTGYPAVLEGAVRSGLQAARTVLKNVASRAGSEQSSTPRMSAPTTLAD